MIDVAVDGRALSPPRTGIGTSLHSLLVPLSRKCRCSIFTPRYIPPFAPSMAARWQIGPAIRGNLYFHLFYPRQAKVNGSDLLLCPLNVIPMRGGPPAVVILHDLTPLEHPGWHRLKNILTTLPFYDFSFRNASAVVCVSRDTARIFSRLFPGYSSKTHVIPHGFPGSPIESSPVDFDLPDEFIFTLATLEPRKNLKTLIESYRGQTDLPPLVVAGAPGWKSTLAACDNVIHLGYIQDSVKWELYRRARLFVFPSIKEGFGLPVWEALSAGTRVVSTPVPAATEYPNPACLVVGSSGEELIKGIRSALKKETPVIDRSLFPTPEETAGRYLRLFHEVLNR